MVLPAGCDNSSRKEKALAGEICRKPTAGWPWGQGSLGGDRKSLTLLSERLEKPVVNFFPCVCLLGVWEAVVERRYSKVGHVFRFITLPI